MKKILHLFLYLSVLTTLNAQTTPSNLWTPQGIGLLPKNYGISGISVVNKDVIWAVADSFYSNPMPSNHSVKVLKTTNGGTNWQVYTVDLAVGRFGTDIHAFDGSSALIAVYNVGGTRHDLLKTIDGGTTWTSKNNTRAAALFVRFFDKQNGFIWNRESFARTQDGGETWTPSTIFTWLNTEVFFTAGSTNACITIGDTIMGGTSISRIALSTDKGITWKFQDLRAVPTFGEQVTILSLAFKDARNGIAMGWNKTTRITYLASTTDGGTTWTNLSNYPFTFGSAIEYVRGTNNTYFITESYGLSAYTTNAGQSWVKVDSLEGDALRFLDRQTGWVGTSISKVGGPAMYKWNGGNILSSIKVLEAEDVSLKVSPNPTSRFLTVEYAHDFKPTSLTIYDASGKTILTQRNPPTTSQNIDLQDFENGVYLVQLRGTEGVVAQKIVVQH
jgi:photosystem II stability/assembly factor-like uncharacterized protein